MNRIILALAAALVLSLFFSTLVSGSGRSEGRIVHQVDCSDESIENAWTTLWPGTLVTIYLVDEGANMTLVSDGTSSSNTCWIPSSAIVPTASQNEGEYIEIGQVALLHGANCHADANGGSEIRDYLPEGTWVTQLADGEQDDWQLVDLGHARCFIEAINFGDSTSVEQPVIADPLLTEPVWQPTETVQAELPVAIESPMPDLPEFTEAPASAHDSGNSAFDVEEVAIVSPSVSTESPVVTGLPDTGGPGPVRSALEPFVVLAALVAIFGFPMLLCVIAANYWESKDAPMRPVKSLR